jgi:hypothetical protein
MGHSVQLIIGQGVAIASFLSEWPVARVVELRGGWQAIPVDEALYTAIEARHPGAVRPSGLHVSPLGLSEAVAAATVRGAGLAYVETEYFGGTGAQSAVAFVEGREVVAPQSARSAGPINQALRRIGVARTLAEDEFDTIGLGERRSMTDYEPEGPVRLRRRAAPAAAPTKAAGDKGYVPLWKIGLFIVAFIAVGVFVAIASQP